MPNDQLNYQKNDLIMKDLGCDDSLSHRWHFINFIYEHNNFINLIIYEHNNDITKFICTTQNRSDIPITKSQVSKAVTNMPSIPQL